MAKNITRTKAVKLMDKSGGRFITVTFKKKDTTERTINCIVKKDHRTALGYLRVYSIQDKGYRSIDPRTINKIVANKTLFKVK